MRKEKNRNSLLQGAGRKSLKGERREREEKLPASRTLRVGLCHSGTLASACVVRLSSKSSCPEFTESFGTYQRGMKG